MNQMIRNDVVPMVIEQTGGRTRLRYLFPSAPRQHYFIGTPIDDNIANLVIAQMLFLAQEDPEKDIQLYVNSRWLDHGGMASTTPCSM